jgi:hypothetical protein
MIQLVANGIFLDLYETDAPKLTYSIEDITDTKITSVYSKSFRVPATKTNTKFFKTAFDINGFDFDITVKVSAELLVDGITLKKGQIRLQKVYITNSYNAAEYEIVFLGESKTFSSIIGDDLINQLDLSEYNTQLTWTNISQSWQAWPGNPLDPSVGPSGFAGSLNGGLFSGSIIFPLVDFGNTYSASVPEQATISMRENKTFTNSATPIRYDRFKPMVRAKVIWDKIFSGSGYTYTSEFLDSNFFRTIYLSAWGNEASITPLSGSVNTLEARGIYDSNVADSQYVSLEELRPDYGAVFDPNQNWNDTNNYYVVPETGEYDLIASFDHLIYFKYSQVSALNFLLGNYDSKITFKINKVSGATTTTIASTTWYEDTENSTGDNVYTKISSIRAIEGTVAVLASNVSLTAGDYVYPTITWLASENTDVEYVKLYLDSSKPSYFKVTSAPPTTDIAITALLKNDYKQIDFIKDISTKFRLVLAPDSSDPNNFIVEPWSQYIGTGDVLDWTGKLDLSKDITIEPTFYTQKKKIVFKDKEDGDYFNQLNKQLYNETFGQLNFESPNDLLSNERQVTTNFSPTIITQPRDWNYSLFPTDEDSFYWYIPQVWTKDSGEYKPIVPNSRLLIYGGMARLGTDSWYVRDESDTVHTISDFYPRVSPNQHDGWTGFNISSLNWQNEGGYIENSVNDFIWSSPSVYDNYWSDYINDYLYNKWSRKVTAYFVLDIGDLSTFDFKDVIFVKDAYYYIEKIYDAPLDKKESIKVDLIKLNNYTPDTSNFIPPVAPTEFNVWGDWPVIWNTTTDGWDD